MDISSVTTLDNEGVDCGATLCPTRYRLKEYRAETCSIAPVILVCRRRELLILDCGGF
jgi:hypothetical protein